MAAADSQSLVGRVVDGSYRIEALLGTGAVGAVYRATEQGTGRTLALKQWHAGIVDDQIRGRFLREAKALDTLQHPNIVKVFGHGFVDGVPYVALEYLVGETLEDLLSSGGPLSPDLALDIAQQALSAIAYAHERNVVHRDLKPENIFLVTDAAGRKHVKILDYGLAKFMTKSEDPTGDVSLTLTGMVMGTPLYMPPEQAAGSSVDLPVDVYAIGCVLFEMLTGRPPYLGESQMELLAAHMRAAIPKLADARPDLVVAPELQGLIDQALAKRQTRRFPDAGAMLQALQALPKDGLLRPRSKPAPATAASGARAAPGQSTFTRIAIAAAVVLLASSIFALLR